MPSNSLLFGKSATYSAKRFPQRMNLPHIMDSVFLWIPFFLLDRLSPAPCRGGIDLVEHDAGFTHSASCFDAKLLADRFGQILDDMRLVSEFFASNAVSFTQCDSANPTTSTRVTPAARNALASVLPAARSASTSSHVGIRSVLSSDPSKPEYDGEYCPFLNGA